MSLRLDHPLSTSSFYSFLRLKWRNPSSLVRGVDDARSTVSGGGSNTIGTITGGIVKGELVLLTVCRPLVLLQYLKVSWPSKLARVLAGWFLLFGLVAMAQTKETRRVLIFYETDLSFPGVALIDSEIRAGLEKSPYKIDLYTEQLETTLFPDEASQRMFREWYGRKYQGHMPDVIIAAGPAPIKFMVDAHERFFPNIPIVLCGSDEGEAGSPKLDPQFTGAWLVADPAKTLEAALRLLPRTRQVVIVGGASPYDRGVEAVVKDALQTYASTLQLVYLTDLDLPTLFNRLKQLPENTIILYTNISEDASGKHFVGTTQVLPMLAAEANAPVFILSDTQIGQGTVGGYLVSFAADGRAAAKLATRILQGKKPADIPFVRDTSTYMFDWRALQRWGLNESDLPPGSIVLNRQPSLWEAYKKYLVGGVSLCLIEGLLIFGLLWHRSRRRKVELSLVERLTFESLLSELSTSFINLPDEQLGLHIEENLRHMAYVLHMERITLHEFSRDRTELRVAFSWRAEGVPRIPGVVKMAQVPWWGKRLLHGETILVSELNAIPEEAYREKESLFGLGTSPMASVPLEVGGEVIGLLSFSSAAQPVPWTEDLVKQLKAFADVFANTLGRKNKETVLRESEERLRLAAQIGRMYAYDWDVASDTVVRSAEAASILGLGGASLTRHESMALVHPDDRAIFSGGIAKLTPGQPDTQRAYRILRPDSSLVWLEETAHAFFDDQGNVVRVIGMVADISERKRAEAELSSVAKRLIDAQEQERTRIARELHDDINQQIALITVRLGQLKRDHPNLAATAVLSRFDDLRKGLFDVGVNLQAVSHRLHSSKLEYLGFVVAAKGFCKEFSEQQKLEITFTHSNIPATLPPDISLCLFRVLQEAVQNAAKHSGSQRIEVSLRGIPGALELIIRDCGRGFDPQDAMRGRGLGLTSMRERVGLVKGTISISSMPTNGTEIKLRVPTPAEILVPDSQSLG
jgi:PAS domain S-box-containing protein